MRHGEPLRLNSVLMHEQSTEQFPTVLRLHDSEQTLPIDDLCPHSPALHTLIGVHDGVDAVRDHGVEPARNAEQSPPVIGGPIPIPTEQVGVPAEFPHVVGVGGESGVHRC